MLISFPSELQSTLWLGCSITYKYSGSVTYLFIACMLRVGSSRQPIIRQEMPHQARMLSDLRSRPPCANVGKCGGPTRGPQSNMVNIASLLRLHSWLSVFIFAAGSKKKTCYETWVEKESKASHENVKVFSKKGDFQTFCVSWGIFWSQWCMCLWWRGLIFSGIFSKLLPK